MIITPLNSNSYNVTFTTTTSQPVTAVTAASAVIRNLQCATLTDQVVFSLTLDLNLAYTSGVTPVTDGFQIPYANVLSVPGTVAGMSCDIAATITAGTIDITPGTNQVVWSITFTITANTFFPPPQAIDVDSNIATTATTCPTAPCPPTPGATVLPTTTIVPCPTVCPGTTIVPCI